MPRRRRERSVRSAVRQEGRRLFKLAQIASNIRNLFALSTVSPPRRRSTSVAFQQKFPISPKRELARLLRRERTAPRRKVFRDGLERHSEGRATSEETNISNQRTSLEKPHSFSPVVLLRDRVPERLTRPTRMLNERGECSGIYAGSRFVMRQIEDGARFQAAEWAAMSGILRL